MERDASAIAMTEAKNLKRANGRPYSEREGEFLRSAASIAATRYPGAKLMAYHSRRRICTFHLPDGHVYRVSDR